MLELGHGTVKCAGEVGARRGQGPEVLGPFWEGRDLAFGSGAPCFMDRTTAMQGWNKVLKKKKKDTFKLSRELERGEKSSFTS